MSNSIPKISYIIAAYNAEKFIGDCIKSILLQEWDNFEIIVSDDGSLDKTIAIAEAFNHPAVRIITGINGGQCKATNRALEIYTGDYVQYIDADDMLAPGKIKEQMQLQQVYGPTFITFSSWASFSENPSDMRIENNPAYIDADPADWLINLFTTGGMLANSCYIISRELINKCGFYNENLTRNNDLEYFSRTILGSERVIFCKDALTLYRRNVNNNLSSKAGYMAFKSEFDAKNMAAQYLLATDSSLNARMACANLYVDIANQTYRSYPDIKEKAFCKLKEIKINRPPLPGASLVMTLLVKLFGIRLALYIKSLIS